MKNLRLHERLAKKAYNLWPQTKVTLKHLNFNSQTAKPLMAAMGYRVPDSCNSKNLLWWTSLFLFNDKDSVYPTGGREKGWKRRKIHGLNCTAEHVARLLTKILGYAPTLLERVTSTGRTLHVHIATLVQTQKSIGAHGELGLLLAELHKAQQQFSVPRAAQAASSSSTHAAHGGLPSSSPLQFTAHASAANADGMHAEPASSAAEAVSTSAAVAARSDAAASCPPGYAAANASHGAPAEPASSASQAPSTSAAQTQSSSSAHASHGAQSGIQSWSGAVYLGILRWSGAVFIDWNQQAQNP